MGRHYCSACNSTAVDIHSVLGSADGTVLYGTMVCLYRLIALRNYIGLLCRDFKKCVIANCCNTGPYYWLAAMKQLVNLRNYVVAPLTEEFVFRACILCLIAPCCSLARAVLVCPVFFGAAHLHHAIEQIRLGVAPRKAVLVAGKNCLLNS